METLFALIATVNLALAAAPEPQAVKKLKEVVGAASSIGDCSVVVKPAERGTHITVTNTRTGEEKTLYVGNKHNGLRVDTIPQKIVEFPHTTTGRLEFTESTSIWGAYTYLRIYYRYDSAKERTPYAVGAAIESKSTNFWGQKTTYNSIECGDTGSY